MEKCKILAVAPYFELLSMIEQVSKEFKNIQLETFCGNLNNALNYVKRFPGSSFHVILSRGGTALTLREKGTVPVVSVDVSTYDLLCTMKQVQQFSSRFAVVGYHNIVSTAQNICEILKWDNVSIVEINTESVENAVEKLKSEGVSVLVGDVLSVETAAKYHIRGVLINSSAESIRKAFQDAIGIYYEMQRCQEQYILTTSAIENMDMGVLLLDEEGKVCIDNRILHSLDYDKALKEALVIRKTEKESVRTWRKIHDTKVEISMRKINEQEKIYYLFLFKKIATIPNSSRSIMVEDIFEVENQLSDLFRGEEYIRPILPSANKYCDSHLPIMIVGAEGLQLSSVARYIHRNSAHSGQMFIRIRCDQLTQRQWEQFCNNTDLVLADNNCTLFFEDINKLSDKMQQVLVNYFLGTNIIRKHYILATGSLDMAVPPDGDSFSLVLYKLISTNVLRVPSLAERKKELPSLINLCISELNNELSTNIIGVEPEALNALCEYRWPNNLEQLYLVLRRLIKETTGYYITLETVCIVLNDYKETGEKGKFVVNLNQNLEQIEQDIIRYVFEEEGMNQTATVARLGISRSTLWRKLRK